MPIVATISNSILPFLTFYLYLFPHYVLHYFREGKIALTICYLIAIFLNVMKYSSIQLTGFSWSPTLSSIISYHCLFSSEETILLISLINVEPVLKSYFIVIGDMCVFQELKIIKAFSDITKIQLVTVVEY